MSPGFHSSSRNTYGPLPTYSEICSPGGVAATRAGMMNGTLDDGFPRAWMIRPVGSFRVNRKVFAPVSVISATKDIIF